MYTLSEDIRTMRLLSIEGLWWLVCTQLSTVTLIHINTYNYGGYKEHVSCVMGLTYMADYNWDDCSY